jgi:hypothetical protein
MAQERGVPLAIARGEASEASQSFSALEGELVAVRRAQDAADENILSLAAK